MTLDMRFLRRGLNILVAFVNYYTAMAACYSVMSDERGVFEIKDRTSLQEDEISDSNEDSDGKTHKHPAIQCICIPCTYFDRSSLAVFPYPLFNTQ